MLGGPPKRALPSGGLDQTLLLGSGDSQAVDRVMAVCVRFVRTLIYPITSDAPRLQNKLCIYRRVPLTRDEIIVRENLTILYILCYYISLHYLARGYYSFGNAGIIIASEREHRLAGRQKARILSMHTRADCRNSQLFKLATAAGAKVASSYLRTCVREA